ncbi:hypothetical protein ISF26_24350 (plasmid) [Gloeobacter morelensis MG652769]|nr:hypothetical protein ISF26_24350 [Gloeobacter morelensis MG652769]
MPGSGRKIIHVDMDAFFASVEQRDDPRYSGKPLAVRGMPAQRGIGLPRRQSAVSFRIF